MSTPTATHSKPAKTILIAEHSGFCYGVKMAVDKAFELAETSEKPVYVLGELIHNPQVIERLEKQGVKTVQSIDLIPADSSVLIRTHGVDPELVDKVSAQHAVDVSDATCPDVRRVQERATQLAEEGYTVVVVGKETHPEVIGITAHCRRIDGAPIVAINDPALVEESLKDLPKTRIGVVSQTTQLEENFGLVVAKLAEIARELRVFNTICPATFKRQSAAEKLAHQVELMVVVGGKNSSNTTHLAEVCENNGTKALHVETVDELKAYATDIDAVSTIGVTAGASTPQWLVDDVLTYLNSFNTAAVA